MHLPLNLKETITGDTTFTAHHKDNVIFSVVQQDMPQPPSLALGEERHASNGPAPADSSLLLEDVLIMRRFDCIRTLNDNRLLEYVKLHSLLALRSACSKIVWLTITSSDRRWDVSQKRKHCQTEAVCTHSTLGVGDSDCMAAKAA